LDENDDEKEEEEERESHPDATDVRLRVPQPPNAMVELMWHTHVFISFFLSLSFVSFVLTRFIIDFECSWELIHH
jgi:hypothetical protein